MTLDVLHFIDNKGGNAEEIRESQRKRGLSVELVDEVIQMYTDWVKCKWYSHIQPMCTASARTSERLRSLPLSEHNPLTLSCSGL